jgi:hypothetical protein
MPIDYETEIADTKVADINTEGLLDFTRNIMTAACAAGIDNRFHTVEADPEPIPGEQTDRIYLRDSKPAGNHCYISVNIEGDMDDVYVAFGELQHSGGEPTWGGQYYPQTSDSVQLILQTIKETLK